jgi:hypothetical protein
MLFSKAETDIICHGRNKKQEVVLEAGLKVLMKIEKNLTDRKGDTTFTTSVKCKYSCGSHGGGECSAAGTDDKGICPYSADFPYAIDLLKDLKS